MDLTADAGRLAAALAIACAYLLFCGWTALRHRARRSAGLGEVAETLVAYASQTGFAEQIAIRTAEALRAAGLTAGLLPLGAVDAARLASASRLLVVASTTGEGDAPDPAAGFVGRVMATGQPLAHLRYAVLALGDRSYRNYCAFGHRLDAWLRHQGATPLFGLTEVDNGDERALRRWRQELSRLTGAEMAAWRRPDDQRWTLVERRLLNPGSLGEGVFHLALAPPPGAAVVWQAGDIAEIRPCGPAEAAAGPPPPHRDYSIASLPSDGRIELLVRRMRHADGRLGLGSGWLTAHAPLGGEILLRLRENRNFHAPEAGRPMILVGNGTGMAGLRAHLKARAIAGRHRNWLLFGERSRARDFFHRDEIEAWGAAGVLPRLDLAFSRDQEPRVHVQDLLRAAGEDVRAWVADGAALYVCGSLRGMAGGVDAALAEILGRQALDRLAEQGRYRRDVY